MFAMFAALAATAPDPCEGSSTYELNRCAESQLEKSQKRLDQYVGAAINRHLDPDGKPDHVAAVIRASETAFEAYRSIECDAVYEDWREGTIRGVMSLGCKLKLTDERTLTVWRNWLRYMDSTPPILPEPKPTE